MRISEQKLNEIIHDILKVMALLKDIRCNKKDLDFETERTLNKAEKKLMEIRQNILTKVEEE